MSETLAIPHVAPHAEMALLGGLILEPKMLYLAQEIIPGPEVFYQEAHAAIYAIMLSFDLNADAEANIVTLVEEAKRVRSIASLGGADYFEKLAGETPGATGIPTWARQVVAAWRRRRLIDLCQHTAFDLGRNPDAFEGILDALETNAYALHDGSTNTEPQSMNEILESEFQRIEHCDGRTGVLSTGYPDLDGLLSGGLGRGDFVILAARPSMGKSAAMMCVAANIAREVPVGIMSMEMGKQSVSQRIISIVAGISLQGIVTGRWVEGQSKLGKQAEIELRMLAKSIVIDDSSSMTPMQVRARARGMARRYKIGALFVDYMQLMHCAGQSENRQVEVSEISRNLKSLARDLDIPVVCLSQLNRQSENRADNRPRMSDLRESGSIEQDADVVVLLHREEYYHQNNPSWAQDAANRDKVGVADFIVAKQRNGPTGIVKFTWDAECARFTPYVKPYMNAAEERPIETQERMFPR